MKHGKAFVYSFGLFFLFAAFWVGCGGGGGGADPAPVMSVSPATYDFGIVTEGNTAQPLEVKIANNGTANLQVSAITLSDTDNFRMDLNGGVSPQNTTTPTIAPGQTCTLTISFTPQAVAAYGATLTIQASGLPNETVALKGISEPVTNLNVRINQVEAENCNPDPGTVTSYISVSDQGGFAVAGLTPGNFKVFEKIGDNSTERTILSVSPVPDEVPYEPISVALLMDYSPTVRRNVEKVSDLEAAAALLVDQMGGSDEMEIIKFADEFSVQDFTSGTNSGALKSFISDSTNSTEAVLGNLTRLYDVVWKGVTDTASRSNNRKVVIVITDGLDDNGAEPPQPLSIKTLPEVIAEATKGSGIPVFTVGVGQVVVDVMNQLANDTGGQSFLPTVDNSNELDYLSNVFNKKLGPLLFQYQYILNYLSGMAAGDTGDLTIQVATAGGAAVGEDTRQITPCPAP